jgi:transposase InsO family protein
LIRWIGIGKGKYYQWCERYGKINEHNAWIPRDFWLEDWEKDAIIAYCKEHPHDGYRRLTYMMMDANVVAVSPSSVYRVLFAAGLLRRSYPGPSSKGTGFVQPTKPHEHWHVDISYIAICGTFYYLCSVLDGCSRYIVNWDIRQSMTETDVEIIIVRAHEKYPDASPRIISDNGPQFIAKDFKEFIRICGMTQMYTSVKTSPYYPQSNGKIERWHQSLKSECIRPGTPLSLEDAHRLVGGYVDNYNNVRLHSSLLYVTPRDKMEGQEIEIFSLRNLKLETAREKRKEGRHKKRHKKLDGEMSLVVN